MNGKKINIYQGKLRVLVAPLDWGLGHATRCIPIIAELISLDCEVLIAAEKATSILLSAEFPTLTILPLPGYEIRYSNTNKTSTRIALQIPKIIRCIRQENSWLKKIVAQYKINLVISDNRPGLHHKAIPCIYITHQLNIPAGNAFAKWAAQKMHYHFINQFDACLVPDAAGNINLAGYLSHPKKMPHTPVYYLGPLSRFEIRAEEKKYELLILLSGPEPQRTILEKILLEQLKNYPERCLLVRGLPNSDTSISVENKNIKIAAHLSAAALNKAILQSKIVISRSGYTTVMDLVKLKQQAILIATPGQAEQEYLSKILLEKKLFFSADQSLFLLDNVLKNAALFSFVTITIDQEEYKQVLRGVLSSLTQAQ